MLSGPWESIASDDDEGCIADKECIMMQEEEWEVLKSIFPDVCISNDAGPFGRAIKLEIPVELSPARSVTIVPSTPPQSHSHTTGLLTALPPFLLALILPPEYPLCASPRITSLTCAHGWYPSSDLQTQLAGMWTHDSQGVLYTWVAFISGGEFLESGDITITNSSPLALLPLLESYDTRAQDTAFAETTFPCAICLSSHKGRHCVRLACGHVFCRSCLTDFWSSCIREGDIGRVGCPDAVCVKAGQEAGEEDIVRVVEEEEVERWKWLREKRVLERDPGMVHCPACQTAVPSPEESNEESGWARLRTCARCEFVFCAFCRRTWHGPISECPLAVTESFVMEYMGLEEGDARRYEIERRWGKRNVLRLVLKYEEERMNREWISRCCTSCPGCGVRVEKSAGCNHMTCIKCKQHFCYLCGEKLPGSEPYKHFNTIGKNCFEQLFDVVV
ncbi:uncharacterized protein HD556DRAFT_1317944 [Suillus plorans]|uniref:RBR-type E3 ubiquitin transferase n=1 Tax=Suillus plorans TaxID=116603 RepID=A0A9P7E3Y5_9AGAM|nr:uncharacterized protein HD556DRAFT_1317944 [Suillus plorans]KAG1810105.1 hypothetical protein HD556DRAFT_1317944 [Suillus plorans]